MNDFYEREKELIAERFSAGVDKKEFIKKVETLLKEASEEAKTTSSLEKYENLTALLLRWKATLISDFNHLTHVSIPYPEGHSKKIQKARL